MEKKTDISLIHEFTEIGDTKIEVKLKYNNLSLYRLRDEYDSITTLLAMSKIDLSHIDFKNVNSLFCLFQFCESVTSVGDLSNWNTSNVTDMTCMLNHCPVLTSVGDLSKWDTSKVETLRSAFRQCYLITSFGDLSHWNLSTCKSLYSTFSKLPLINSFGDLSNWNVSNITTIEYLFNECNNLTKIGNLSNWNTNKCSNMHAAFSCSMLNDFGVPPIYAGTNTVDMFTSCEKLTNIIASGKISASVSFSDSPLTKESALILFNALDADNVGTLALSTTTKALLSEDEIKIATNKGWTIA